MYSLAISTYFREGLNPERLNLFKKSIDSLLNSNFDSTIFLCDDGSDTQEHINYIDEINDSRIQVIKKGCNGGYSRIKNLGIQLILNSGCDFGFLCDDDILYQPNWFVHYIDAYNQTRYPHYCFYDHEYNIHIKDPGQTFIHNNIALRRTPMLQGGMLTFSKEMINKIGYIKVFPRKLGHEHTHWTLKAINRGIVPGFIDLNDSINFLGYCDKSGTITTRPEDFEEQANENSKFMYEGYEINEPCLI